MRALVILALWAAPTMAQPPAPAELLTYDGAVAVIRVTEVHADGSVVGEVVAHAPSDLPQRLTIGQQGPIRHALKPGMVMATALRQDTSGWRYVPFTAAPVAVRVSTARSLARFLRDARSARAAPLNVRFDLWLRALDHPSPLARTLAFGRLMAHRDQLLPLFEPERVNRVADLLVQPGKATPGSDLTMRLLIGYANESVVRWLDTHWVMLRSDRLRLQAVGAFQKVVGPVAEAAIDRCAREASGSAKTRCVRVQSRRKSTAR